MNVKRSKWGLITIICIILLSVVIFRQYIIDGYYFLSKGLLSDLLRANLPTYYHLFDSITEGGFFWSWQMGIGTSMFTHADVYFDPFTYILFIFGRNYIPNMMICLFVGKLICEGAAFFVFLKHFKIDSRAITIASVLYAFCGYSMIMGSNFALGTILVYAPIVFLGAEKWLDSGKVKLLAVSLFLTCIYSYYFFYSIGIILVFYICVRMYQKEQNPIPQVLMLGGIALVVILLSAFTIFPQIQLTLNGARVGGNKEVAFGFSLFVPQIAVWFTSIIRTLGLNLLGNPISSSYLGYNYSGGHDYFQISCFVSACFIILIMHYWYYEKNKRKHILMVFAVLSVIILIPMFSYALNAFSTINARWMYVVAIVQCLGIGLSVDSILKNKGLHKKPLFYGMLISFVCILTGYLILGAEEGNYREFFSYGKKFILVILAMYVCMIIIYAIQNKRIQIKSLGITKYLISFFVCFIILIDLGVNYHHFYGSNNSISEYTEAQNCNYEDTSAEIIKKLQINDKSFYRIDKEFDSVVDNLDIPSDNDAMVQQYYGLKNYNSVNNPNYIDFLQRLGIYVTCPVSKDIYIDAGMKPEEITGSELNYINGVGERYQLMGYLGVKYFLTKNDDIEIPPYFDLIYKEGNISVFNNRNYYPLAFCNKGVMSTDEFDSLSEEEKDIALLNYTIIDRENGTELFQNALKKPKELSKMAMQKQDAFELETFSEDNIKFKINVSKGMEYLSFSIPYDRDWKVYIDGVETETEKINISLLGAKVTPGQHKIELKYEPHMFKVGLMISVITLCIVLLTISRWEIWLELLGNWIRKIYVSLNSVIIKFGRRILFNSKFLIILKYICLLLISFSFTVITLFVFRPTTFVKENNIDTITDWSLLEVNGYKVEGNTFTAIKDDASIKIPVNIDYTKVSITLESIGYVADHSDKLNIQMYYANQGEAFSPGKIMLKDAAPNKLQMGFKNNGEKQSNLRLDFGSYKNESFTLSEIQLSDEHVQIASKDYLWIFFGTVLCFMGLIYILNMFSRKRTDDLTRNSNIELCRVICMILIIAHHCVLHGGAFAMDGMGANRIMSLFLIPGGKLCFDAFLAISCWFLVDQNFRTKRFIKVWLLVFFYSVTFAAATSLIAGATVKEFVSTLLPIVGNSHGFAASYLAFYLLLPFLSMISRNLNKKQARWFMFILMYFQVGSQIIGSFNNYIQPLSSELLLFIMMYFIALNLKKWPLTICYNKKVMISIFIIIWLGLWFVRYSYILNPENRVLAFIMGTMCDESSITNIVGGFALFFFFKELKVKRRPFINWLATGAFGILLIHDHNLFRYVLWNDLIKTEIWNDSAIFVFLVIATVIWVFIMCFAIDRLRAKYLEEPIMSHPKIIAICEKFDNMLNSKGEDTV